MPKQTRQIRILTEGQFQKLMKIIHDRILKEEGFYPSTDQVCESIAKKLIKEQKS